MRQCKGHLKTANCKYGIEDRICRQRSFKWQINWEIALLPQETLNHHWLNNAVDRNIQTCQSTSQEKYYMCLKPFTTYLEDREQDASWDMPKRPLMDTILPSREGGAVFCRTAVLSSRTWRLSQSWMALDHQGATGCCLSIKELEQSEAPSHLSWLCQFSF